MLYQNDPEFPLSIQRTGCHFMSLLYVGLGPTFDNLSYFDVLELLDRLQETRIVTYDGYVMYPQKMLNYLGDSYTYHGITADEPAPKDLLLGLYQHHDKKHFVVMNDRHQICYDPIRGGSTTVAYGHLKNIRLIRFQEPSSLPL